MRALFDIDFEGSIDLENTHIKVWLHNAYSE